MKRTKLLLAAALVLAGLLAPHAARAQGECQQEVCDQSGCTWVPVTNGTACDDHDFCTTGDVCVDGVCVGGAPLQCEASDACHIAACDPAEGCINLMAPDFTECTDADPCTLGDHCVMGQCISTVKDCNDADACTVDYCDAQTGECVHPPVAIDDGNACTNDWCDALTGDVYHFPVNVDDGDLCTDDTCDGSSGQPVVSHTTHICEDMDACTSNQCDPQVGCQFPAIDCDDHNPCTTDLCDHIVTGCMHIPLEDATPCDDGDPNTVDDVCQSGLCTGTPVIHTSVLVVAPQAPGSCITPAHACVDVPVTIADRPDAIPVRAISVSFTLAGGLSVCSPAVTEGTYLSDVGLTHLEVVDHGGGAYTVDAAILGTPCGATAAAGTLFTLHLTSTGASGTGSVTVTTVLVRDCDNVPVTASSGAPVTVAYDNEVPPAVAMSATQQKSGNDGDGTTVVNVSWTGTVTPGDSVLAYRAPYGAYPEYGPGAGIPAVPAYPPPAPWALAARVTAGAAFADQPPERDFWYYVAFVKDPCGNVSPVSNRTAGTLDYFLGDVTNGAAACAGDNRVGTQDISLLGSHYGAGLATPDALACLDVGPTVDGAIGSRPVPDNSVDFEDLVMFAINYNLVSAPQAALAGSPAATDALSLDAPARVSAGATFPVLVRMKGSGGLQAVSTQLAWDRDVAEPVAVGPGALLAPADGVVLSARPGRVDAAALGAGRGIAGEGVLAVVTFLARATGEPRIAIAAVDARDGSNRKVALAAGTPATPRVTALAPAQPNPFRDATTFTFGLATGGAVRLEVYGLDGRRVAVLLDESRVAGTHQVKWDGRDGAGQPLRPGFYFARLTTAQERCTRSLVILD